MPKNSDEMLAEISGVIQGVAARQEVHAEGFTKRLDSIEVSLNGNGKPGIKTRIDRLEVSEAKRSKGVWLGGAALLAAVGAWARELLR